MEMTSQSALSKSGWPTGLSHGPVGGNRAAARQRSDVTMLQRDNAVMRQCPVALYSRSLGASGASGVSAGSQLHESSWKEPRSAVSLLASERQTHCRVHWERGER